MIEGIRETVIRIVIFSVLLMLTDILLPSGRIRHTAKFVCTVIVSASVAMSVLGIGEISLPPLEELDYAETAFSSAELCQRNAERRVEKVLEDVRGFEDSTVLVKTEEIDYICRVTGIVIYCKTPDTTYDEEVMERICQMYELERENVVITR